jgi:WD40 repeat protein
MNTKNSAKIGGISSDGNAGPPGNCRVMLDNKNVTPRPLLQLVPRDTMEELEKQTGADEEVEEEKEEAPAVVPEAPSVESREKKKETDKKRLEMVHAVHLKETETFMLMELPSLCVPIEPHDEHSRVTDRNKSYDNLCVSKASSDQYIQHHTQTLNNPQKVKEVHAAPPQSENVHVNASQWDIYDTFVTPSVSKAEQLTKACRQQAAATAAACLRKPGCLLRLPETEGEKVHKAEVKAKSPGGKMTPAGVAAETPHGSHSVPSQGPSPEHQTPDIPEEEGKEVELLPWKIGLENGIQEELLRPLRIMERIVSQNTFHKQHMVYRNYPTLDEMEKLDQARTNARSPKGARSGIAEKEEVEPEEGNEEAAAEKSDEARLQDLFSFDCQPLTQGLCVTSADWNRVNQDVLAVSYGDLAPIQTQGNGLVLFWSLKNPTYPERVLRTSSGVTALNFSNVYPNLIAAGLHDGQVCIWDLRKPQSKPVLESGPSTSTHSDRKHIDVVWDLQWVDKGPDKVPRTFFASTSSDGRVLQWTMKKGLEQTMLMQLKRVPNPNLGSNSVYGHKEGIVFRQASGFCIDFPANDPANYLVGTEGGLIHRCSTSYNEQYLDTYTSGTQGHSAPVYKVRCNPFWPAAFLTCSADWTMKLWSTKPVPGMTNHSLDAPIQSFQSTDLADAVNDIFWSPNNSTSFAAAMDDGRVELWDLKKKPLDPVVVHYPREQTNVRRTCVRFSTNSPVLIAGDANGCVDVMRMYNCEVEMFSEAEQQERLISCMAKKK